MLGLLYLRDMLFLRVGVRLIVGEFIILLLWNLYLLILEYFINMDVQVGEKKLIKDVENEKKNFDSINEGFEVE